MSKTLYQLHVDRWRDCQRCELASQRDRVVFARGKVPCDVLLVGEAPGESEDALGQPMVGPAGQLLDRIVADALDQSGGGAVSTADGGDQLRVAFYNLVGCFPAEAKHEGTNEPPKEAIKACSPKLVEFMWLAQPRLVVCVGALAKKHVANESMFWGPGNRCEWLPDGIALEFKDIIHPAAILRANIAQRDLLVQRCTVVLANAFESLLIPF